MSEGTNPFKETATNLLPSTNLDFDEAPTSKALTLSSQGTNLVFRSSYSKDTNPLVTFNKICVIYLLDCHLQNILHCSKLLDFDFTISSLYFSTI